MRDLQPCVFHVAAIINLLSICVRSGTLRIVRAKIVQASPTTAVAERDGELETDGYLIRKGNHDVRQVFGRIHEKTAVRQ